jgi:IgA Peptidase M64
MRKLALALTLGLSVAPAAAHAFPVTVLQQTGPIDKRYNIAVLGDGYRSDDQAKLTSDATTLVDDIFDQPPYASYRGLFNIKIVQAVSVDRGARGGAAGGDPNTVFSASFSCEGGVSRLLCVDEKAVLAAAARDVPEFNLAVVISNDTKYGGSGGDVPCVSTNRQASEIIRHELSHNLADLADEYETAYPGFPACSRTNDCREPNVTLRNARADIKWLDWIPAATQVPTPEGARIAGVGLFEGARYLASGVYRPVESACKMRSLGQPFCPVCSEGLVRSFWNLPNTHLVDDAEPAGNVQTSACTATTLSVTTPAITPSTLTFTWTIDGQPQMATTPSFTLSPRAVAEGQHTVTVTVKDATPLVRHDPQGALQEQHAWTLTVTPCGDASVPIDAGNGAGAGGSGADGGRTDAGRAGSGGGSGAGGNGSAGASGITVDASGRTDGPVEMDGGTARPDDAAASADARGGSAGSGTAGGGGRGDPPRRPASDTLEGGCTCGVASAPRDDATRFAWLVLGSALIAWRRRPRAA